MIDQALHDLNSVQMLEVGGTVRCEHSTEENLALLELLRSGERVTEPDGVLEWVPGSQLPETEREALVLWKDGTASRGIFRDPHWSIKSTSPFEDDLIRGGRPLFWVYCRDVALSKWLEITDLSRLYLALIYREWTEEVPIINQALLVVRGTPGEEGTEWHDVKSGLAVQDIQRFLELPEGYPPESVEGST